MATTLNEHYRQQFGCKVYKLSLDAGFTCPNRDGTLGTKGCIFCSGSAEFAEGPCESIASQLEQAKARQEDLRFEVEAATVAYENYRDSLGETDSATIAAKQNLERYKEEHAEAISHLMWKSTENDLRRK